MREIPITRLKRLVMSYWHRSHLPVIEAALRVFQGMANNKVEAIIGKLGHTKVFKLKSWADQPPDVGTLVRDVRALAQKSAIRPDVPVLSLLAGEAVNAVRKIDDEPESSESESRKGHKRNSHLMETSKMTTMRVLRPCPAWQRASCALRKN
jgi:hypothetical protein